MTSRLRQIPVEIRVVAAALVVAVGLALARGRGGSGHGSIELPADVGRLEWQHVPNLELTSASDVVRLGEFVYLLDARSRQIAILRLGGENGLVYDGRFGRRGDGPGELQRPVDIAPLPADSGLAVIETGGRISRFDRTGQYLRSDQLRLPCPMVRLEGVILQSGETFVSGQCATPERSADTVFAVLYLASPGKPVRELLREPLYTIGGDWGTAYFAQRSLVEGEHVVAFGTGTERCLWVLRKDDPAQRETHCGMRDLQITITAPGDMADELRRERARGRMRGSVYEWPDPFPTYRDKFLVEDRVGLVRLSSPDSLFLAWLSAPMNPLLIAPAEEFVGCHRDTCVWYRATMEGSDIALYCLSSATADEATPCTIAAETVSANGDR